MKADEKILNYQTQGIFAFVLFIFGFYLLTQSKFDFWLTKPVGAFCLFFPLGMMALSLRLNYFMERDRSLFLDRVMEASPDVIYVFDRNKNQVIVLNGGFPTLGYDNHELALLGGNLFHAICPPDEIASVMKSIHDVINDPENSVLDSEWRFKSKSGELKIFHVHQTLLSTDPAEPLIIGFARDISQERKLEIEGKKNYDQLMRAERFSSLRNLGSSVAHEIATPLTVILTTSGILRDQINSGELDLPNINKTFDNIDICVQKINKTIGALRTITKSSADEPITSLKINTILEDIDTVLNQRMKNHGFNFTIVKAENDIEFNAKKSQIINAIYNICSYAFESLQKAEKKWVKIETTVVNNILQVSITDSRNALSTDNQKNIFESLSTSTNSDLTSLELTVARRIAVEHEGNLILDSNCPNVRFILQLPLEVAIEKKSA